MERANVPSSFQDGYWFGAFPDTSCLANFRLSRSGQFFADARAQIFFQAGEGAFKGVVVLPVRGIGDVILADFFRQIFANESREAAGGNQPAAKLADGGGQNVARCFCDAKNSDMNEKASSKTQRAGLAGTYLVAAELTLKGFIATITCRNAKAVDILAYNPSLKKTIEIQVKTSSEGVPSLGTPGRQRNQRYKLSDSPLCFRETSKRITS